MTKNCGSCKFWRGVKGNYGDCLAPMPYSAYVHEKEQTEENEGQNCPTWEERK